MRTLVLALTLLAVVAGPALAATTFVVRGTQPPVGAQAVQEAAAGYYPRTFTVQAGDAVRFEPLLPTDDHPALVTVGDTIVEPDEGGYFRDGTTYSGLAPGAYAFVCIWHSYMTGSFEVI